MAESVSPVAPVVARSISTWVKVALLVSVLAVTFRALSTRELLNRGSVSLEIRGDRVVGMARGAPGESAGLLVGDSVLETLPAGRLRLGDHVTYVVERGGVPLRFDMVAVRELTRPGPGFRYLVAETAMGMVFFFCGLLVLWVRRDFPAALWMLYGAAMVLHGGGWPSTGPMVLREIGYDLVLLGIMLGGSAILHLLLVFPEPLHIARRGSVRLLIPGAAALGVALALLRHVASDSGAALTQMFYSVAVVQGYAFTLLAFLVLLRRGWRASPQARRDDGLHILVGGMVLATLPYLLANLLALGASSAGGHGTGSYTLLFSLIAVAFTWALLRSHRRRGVLRPVPGLTPGTSGDLAAG